MIPDHLFAAYRRQKVFSITPYNDTQLQPVSYDVTLGAHAMMFSRMTYGALLDLGIDEPLMDHFTIPHRDKPWIFVINPGDFVLGHTRERLKLSACAAAEFMGKSTLGRVGLFVHVTAGLIDPGWGGASEEGNPLTVELYNASPRPLRLWEGMPIGQLVFTMLPEQVARPYGHDALGNHYVNDQTVAGSRGFHGRSETQKQPETASATASIDARGSRDAASYEP